MRLIEECRDAVALLEAGDLWSNSNDLTSTIRPRDNTRALREWVLALHAAEVRHRSKKGTRAISWMIIYLWNDKIAIVE